MPSVGGHGYDHRQQGLERDPQVQGYRPHGGAAAARERVRSAHLQASLAEIQVGRGHQGDEPDRHRRTWEPDMVQHRRSRLQPALRGRGAASSCGVLRLPEQAGSSLALPARHAEDALQKGRYSYMALRDGQPAEVDGSGVACQRGQARVLASRRYEPAQEAFPGRRRWGLGGRRGGAPVALAPGGPDRAGQAWRRRQPQQGGGVEGFAFFSWRRVCQGASVRSDVRSLRVPLVQSLLFSNWFASPACMRHHSLRAIADLHICRVC